ncbi:MAG: TAXI family TRAP transporter solute-binding subunit [Deltaproteobacteria bacterium]|nr:TAXI family TRAP transporter solute-binding subunit [Deltaproteobacteria bacterium]
MRNIIRHLTLFILAVALLAPAGFAKEFLSFTGGPSGGTFQYFSNGMAIRLSKQIPDIRVSNQASRGSVENIRKVNVKRADFGIAYSGDLYLAQNGLLANDNKSYSNVQVLSFLYKAPAQLAVLKKSGISTVAQLAGKKVALGGPGSGAAASAERFFKLVGLWDKIDRQFLGYSTAASAMKDGHIDAMWILAGYPTRALIELAAMHEVVLLDVYDEAAKSGLEEKLPFYQKEVIPANTYDKVIKPTQSFFDSALWVVNKDVSEEAVYNALKEIYSEEGLAYMVSVKSTAKQMSVANGITGVVTRLHPGAIKFWKEKGLKISANQGGEPSTAQVPDATSDPVTPDTPAAPAGK